jgi:hypothetical protein
MIFVVNLKSAKALGLNVPITLVGRGAPHMSAFGG